VPTAGDGVARRRSKREEELEDAGRRSDDIVSARTSRTREEEGAAPIMEERRIGRPREVTERDVALVTGAADRVVALVPCTQLVGFDVGDATVELRGEELARETCIDGEARGRAMLPET
jgi:hypothetical protein